MFNRIVASTLVLFIVVGFVVAKDHNGTIVKFEDGKITFKAKAKKGEEAKEFTFKVTDKTTFATRGKKGEEPKEAKKDDFETAIKGAKKGLFATITTDDKDEVAEKVVFGKGKKKE